MKLRKRKPKFRNKLLHNYWYPMSAVRQHKRDIEKALFYGDIQRGLPVFGGFVFN